MTNEESSNKEKTMKYSRPIGDPCWMISRAETCTLKLDVDNKKNKLIKQSYRGSECCEGKLLDVAFPAVS